MTKSQKNFHSTKFVQLAKNGKPLTLSQAAEEDSKR